jgi:hypothetical protein
MKASTASRASTPLAMVTRAILARRRFTSSPSV